jgi:signal transduction histidine kinase
LRIEDNGNGFDLTYPRLLSAHGLNNVERRAHLWNGSLNVSSQPGGPTILEIVLNPLRARAQNHEASFNAQL